MDWVSALFTPMLESGLMKHIKPVRSDLSYLYKPLFMDLSVSAWHGSPCLPLLRMKDIYSSGFINPLRSLPFTQASQLLGIRVQHLLFFYVNIQTSSQAK